MSCILIAGGVVAAIGIVYCVVSRLNRTPTRERYSAERYTRQPSKDSPESPNASSRLYKGRTYKPGVAQREQSTDQILDAVADIIATPRVAEYIHYSSSVPESKSTPSHDASSHSSSHSHSSYSHSSHSDSGSSSSSSDSGGD